MADNHTVARGPCSRGLTEVDLLTRPSLIAHRPSHLTCERGTLSAHLISRGCVADILISCISPGFPSRPPSLAPYCIMYEYELLPLSPPCFSCGDIFSVAEHHDSSRDLRGSEALPPFVQTKSASRETRRQQERAWWLLAKSIHRGGFLF